MPLTFHLYLLLYPDAHPQYPYVAISKEAERILLIAEEQTHLLDPSEIIFFPDDYQLTSRTLSLDLSLLDEWVGNYTGQTVYRLLTRFTEEKHITLTYHAPTNEGPKDYDIYLGYPDPRAEALVEKIYPVMLSIKESVFGY
ncbi:MAG: hypothetical protein KGO92_07775 [Bacteroidota bacterium]|nr:hypothetical protein [Bacteroidota bacterium]